MQCIYDYCNKYGIDINDYSQRVNIKHNTVNHMLSCCYNDLFKPSIGLMDNQQSLLDYDDDIQFNAVVNAFLNVCLLFNKSLGLMSFCIYTGINSDTVIRWLSDDEKKLNPKRYSLLRKIQEYNKAMLVDNLKDTPVGAIAVANNDKATGLEWSKQQSEIAKSNTIFILPSERLNRLNLDKKED